VFCRVGAYEPKVRFVDQGGMPWPPSVSTKKPGQMMQCFRPVVLLVIDDEVVDDAVYYKTSSIRIVRRTWE
jgi:hypothetical protein